MPCCPGLLSLHRGAARCGPPAARSGAEQLREEPMTTVAAISGVVGWTPHIGGFGVHCSDCSGG